MLKKLFILILFFSSMVLVAYEITIDTPSKIAKEKVKKKHNFKRDIKNKIVLDIESELMWEDDVFSKSEKKGLVDANNYCHRLTLAGFTNWRLPSIKELAMIADISQSNPAIHKIFKNVQSDFYISGSPRLSDIDTIFYMDFNNGHIYEASRRGRGYVRCVRVNKNLKKFF